MLLNKIVYLVIPCLLRSAKCVSYMCSFAAFSIKYLNWDDIAIDKKISSMGK